MAFSNIRNNINNFLQKTTGYRLAKGSALPNLRGKVTDPREGIYHAKVFPFIMDLPFDRARNWRWFSLNEYSASPFYVATLHFLHADEQHKNIKIIQDIISDYATLVNVSNPIEYLGIEGLDSVFRKKTHPMEIVLPWERGTPQANYEAWCRNTYAENLEYGYKSFDYLGGKNCSEQKIELEALRLHTLIKSIQTRGFLSSPYGLFGAVAMVNENNDLYYYVVGGQHRSSVLAAMGWQTVPVKVSQIIYREEVEYWPAVKAGYYSQEAALKVFDRIFNAEPPPANSKWQELVKTNNSKA